MPTMHIAVWPGGQDNPTSAQIIAQTVPNAVYSVDNSPPEVDTAGYVAGVTGLTAGELYRPGAVWVDGSDVSPLAIGPAFRTVGPYAPGPIIISAKSQVAVTPTHSTQRVGFSSPPLAKSVETGELHGVLSGLTVVYWDAPTPNETPAFSAMNQSLDAQSRLNIDLTGWTTQPAGSIGCYLIVGLNEIDPKRSPVFHSQCTLEVLP